MTLEGDPAWRVAPDEGRLVVTAGADAVWLLEDVPAAVADVVARFWSASPPAPDELPPVAQPVVAHLVGLGALRPAGSTEPRNCVAVVEVGDPAPAFTSALPVRAGADFTVVVRTNAPLRALVDAARELAITGRPHVLCDLAFHHTVALGPHVVPGDTACMACLAQRVGVVWGDPDPPTNPAVASDPADAALAGALVARWLRHGAGLANLVNATVSFDLDDLYTRREPLWPAPGCPNQSCADRWRLASSTSGATSIQLPLRDGAGR